MCYSAVKSEQNATAEPHEDPFHRLVCAVTSPENIDLGFVVLPGSRAKSPAKSAVDCVATELFDVGGFGARSFDLGVIAVTGDCDETRQDFLMPFRLRGVRDDFACQGHEADFASVFVMTGREMQSGT